MTIAKMQAYGKSSSFERGQFDSIIIASIVPLDQREVWEQRYGTTIRFNASMPAINYYLPVTFVYTGRLEQSAGVGFDQLSEPVRRDTVVTAIATGAPAMSRYLKLYDGRPGIAIWLPPVKTREKLFSSRMAGALLSLEAFFARSFPSFGNQSSVYLEVYQEVDTMDLLYKQDPGDNHLWPDEAVDIPLQVTNKQLKMMCIPTEAFFRRFKSSWAIAVFLVIFFIFSGLAVFVHRIVSQYQLSRHEKQLLRESKKLLKSLTQYSKTVVEAVPDPLVMVDSAGFITGLNKHALAQTGFTAECIALRRTHIKDLLKLDNGSNNLITGTWDSTIYRKNKTTFPARCSVSPLGSSRTDSTVSRVILFTDVTEKKNVELALKKAEKEAKHANKIQKTILYPIIHSANYMTSLLGDMAEYVEGDLSIASLLNLNSGGESTKDDKSIYDIMRSAVERLPLTALEKNLNVKVMSSHNQRSLALSMAQDNEIFTRMIAKLVDVGCRAAACSAQLTLSAEFRHARSSIAGSASTVSSMAPSPRNSQATINYSVMSAARTSLRDVITDNLRRTASRNADGFSDGNSNGVSHSQPRRFVALLRVFISESSAVVPQDVDVFAFKHSSLGHSFGGIGISVTLLRKYVSQLGGTLRIGEGFETETGSIVNQYIEVSVRLLGEMVPTVLSSISSQRSLLRKKKEETSSIAALVKAKDNASRIAIETPMPASPSSGCGRNSNGETGFVRAVSPTEVEILPAAAVLYVFSTDDTQSEQPAQSSIDKSTGYDLNKMQRQILLAEDNLIIQRMTKKLLEKHGYVVTTADNGQQAIDHVAQRDFSAVLMDLIMPVKDGVAATEYIRNVMHKSRSQLPVIVLTANALEEERNRCMSSGLFNDFATKPATADDLNLTLLKHISKDVPEDDAKVDDEVGPSSAV